MRRPIPPVHEDLDTLKQLLKAEHHATRYQRLQMLYLIVSGQATTRRDIAALLGLNRNTISTWLDSYTAGGLPALLTIYVPAGKPAPLNDEQLAQLRERLADPAGWPSYGAIQQWINTTFGLQLGYTVVHKLVRYKLGAKPKVPRPTHPKKTLMP